MTAAVRAVNCVRCPSCGASIALAAGDTRLACTACGLAAPVSRVGTAPGAALVELEPDLAGATLGGYTIVERIGAGGMGTVYRARGSSDDVAVKVLRPGLGVDRAAVLARFAREAAALRRLDHPSVVRFLDHGQDGDVAYIVTELVPGRDLAARLASGPMPLAETVSVFVQVCDGVGAAHAAGIVHRDLKPANILVGEDRVKVADFGLAQLGPDAAVSTLTRTDVAMGTFHYLAPEQRKDARAVDHRADIWALGVILYEMLTGELPLGSFTPPPDRRAAAIVRRALAPDPDARFASVAELGAAVRALAPSAPRRRRMVAALAVAGLLGGASAAAAIATRGASSSSPSSSSSASPAAARVFTSSSYGAAAAAKVATDAAVPADAAAVTVTDAAAAPDATAVAAAPPPERAAPEKRATRPAPTKRPVGKPTRKPAKPPAVTDAKAGEPDGAAAGSTDQLATPRKLSPAELKKLKGKGKGK